MSLFSSLSTNNKQRLQSPCRPGPSWQLASRGDLNLLLLSKYESILIEFKYSRYFAICQPLRSRRWQTLRHAYKLICVIWGSSLLLMSPIAVLSELIPTRDGESEMLCNFTPRIILPDEIHLVFFSFLSTHNIAKNTLIGHEGRKKCRDVWPNEPIEYEKMFTIFLDLFLLVVPLIVLTAAYFLISHTLWRSMDEEKIYIEQMPSMKCVKFYAESCLFLIRERARKKGLKAPAYIIHFQLLSPQWNILFYNSIFFMHRTTYNTRVLFARSLSFVPR